MHTIKVLLADDHTLLRKSLKTLLQAAQPKWVLREAGNGKEAIELINEFHIDVVLLDLRMPVMNGIEAARIIKKKYPQTKIIILTQYEEQSLILHFIKLGVNGFLLKNCELDELADAIKQVYYEGHYFNTLLKQAIEKAVGTSLDKNVKFIFTKNEYKLICYLCEGHNTKEIAQKMQLTEYTVDSYRKKLLRVTNTHNIAELVAFVHRTGIV